MQQLEQRFSTLHGFFVRIMPTSFRHSEFVFPFSFAIQIVFLLKKRKKTYLHECLLIKSSGADKIHLPKASVLKRRLSSCIAVVLLKDCFLLHSAASH